MREVVSDTDDPGYLLHDRDSIFAKHLDDSIRALGLTILRSPFRSPKANAICERVIGTIRRSYIDFVLNAAIPANALAFTVAPRYYDYQLRYDAPPTGSGALGHILLYGSDDALGFLPRAPSGTRAATARNDAVEWFSAWAGWPSLRVFQRPFSRVGGTKICGRRRHGQIFELNIASVLEPVKLTVLEADDIAFRERHNPTCLQQKLSATPKGHPDLFGLLVAMRRILRARLDGDTGNGDA